MKLLTASRTLNIPAGVTVEIKARAVRVKGPRGMLQKDFKHLDVDAYLVNAYPALRSKLPPLCCAFLLSPQRPLSSCL